MDEFSLYVLDIVNNSIRAGATLIVIRIIEEGEILTFSVKDNGCGMSKEQIEKLSDPFFTTRTTRKVGLGVPFLRMLAEMTGGGLSIESVPLPDPAHGTLLNADFVRNHVDFLPLGDLAGTIVTLIQGAPDIDFDYLHSFDGKEIAFDTREIRSVLGEVSLAEPEVLNFIRESLLTEYREAESKNS